VSVITHSELEISRFTAEGGGLTCIVHRATKGEILIFSMDFEPHIGNMFSVLTDGEEQPETAAGLRVSALLMSTGL